MSNEDKAKLDNIAQLQNICEQTKQEGHVVVKSVINENNDNNAICNGMNIRREKTRREKIEMEIKKWNKKVENQKSGIININNNNNNNGISSNHHIVIDDINSCQNNITMNNNNSDMGYDVVKLDEYKKDSNNVKGENNNSNSNNNTTILKHNVNEDYNNSSNNNITQTFICYICQRKFPSEEKLKLHESMSELHKANLEKQKKETLS